MRRGRAATSPRAVPQPWSRGGARRPAARNASRVGRKWCVWAPWLSPRREGVELLVGLRARVEERGEPVERGDAAELADEAAVGVDDGVGRQRDAAGELELVALERRAGLAVVGPELERDEAALDPLGD